MEKPTLFYAICLSLTLMDRGEGAALMLAWAYVALRIAQATTNVVRHRFLLFVGGSLMVIVLTLITVLGLIGP